jgi:glycosyltransferase involved in cell wall biosynthesis
MKLLWTVQRYGSEVLGGSEHAARMFAERMVERGHEVTVLTSCAISYTDWSNVFPPGETIEGGVRVIRLPVAKPRDQEAFSRLHDLVLREALMPLFEQMKWARSIGPDLIDLEKTLDELSRHIDVAVFKAYLYHTATGGIPAISGRVPIVFHPEVHPEEMLNLPLFESIFRQVDALQFNSVEERELIRRRFQFDPSGLVVGIGLDDEQFIEPQESAAILRQLGIGSSPYFLALGRVAEGKGSFELLRYFERFLKEDSLNCDLVFAGERPLDIQTSDRIHFTGYISEEEKRALIARSQGLIQPSYLESFSIVLTEAWALARPVLVQAASDVLRGHVERSGGGLSFSNFSQFRDSVRTLLTQPKIAEQLGESGKEYVSKNFRWSAVLDRFEDVLALAKIEFARKHLGKN